MEDKFMKTHGICGQAIRIYATCVIATMLLSASISPAFGQERSQDRDNPTLLSANELSDDLDGSDDEYFYQFSAGPGKLTVTFEVKASGTNAGAYLDLFGANSRAILSNVLAQGVDNGNERVVKRLQLGRPQNIIMRIKGIRYGDSGGNGVYKVRLDGAVSFKQSHADSGAAPASSNRLTGELDGTDRQLSHTLSITGPGKVTLTFEVKASSTNAGAYFDLLDGNSRPILSDVLVQGVDSGSERVSKSVNFAKPQSVTISVKGISYGSSGGHGVYSVQFDGPITPQNGKAALELPK
jgi:hypothetical protein